MIVVICAAGTTANVICYTSFGHHWWNLASGIFCGIITLSVIINGES